MDRPKSDSQVGRLLALLESRCGQQVHLPEILALRIAQYNSRIFDLRRKYGFRIESGSEPDHPERTWFRLIPTTRAERSINSISENSPPQKLLFSSGSHRDLG